MTSYKIHSLKDSKKLSFIIEWEDGSSVSQKLSEEWHIILSVEKIETPTENLFCFEGKKASWSFIEGKIASEDIFVAYEILKNEYKYIVTKLYPETVVDTEKQEKIFQELLATFQETTVKKAIEISDTSKETLIKNKKILEKLIIILQKRWPRWAEILIPDLKKLKQNNNLTLIQQELKTTLKKLSSERWDKELEQEIKTLMKEMGMFVIPDGVIKILEIIEKWFKSLDPLFHPSEIHPQRHNVDQNTSKETIQKEYLSIHDNTHIHTFLRKKYRPKISQSFKADIRKYYFYTLFREKKTLLFGKKALKNITKIISFALIIVIFFMCAALLSGLYSSIFVTSGSITLFMVLIVASLVIRNETV